MSGTLLLADDSITIQKVVELTFAETEHKVVAVGNGRELFRRLADVKPDVVLCDVVMPDMNGYEVCQNLKSDPATLHIPVVLLTGTFEPFDRDRALAAGCDAIVTKPFEARELISIVDDLLRRAEAVAAAAPPVGGVGLTEIGVPEGVPSLDYSTTGFDRMVAMPPPAAPAPPENAIELTASSLGDSHPKRVPQVPPELQEAPAPAASVVAEPPSVAVAPPPAAVVPAAPPAPPAAPAAASEPTAEVPWIQELPEAEPLTGHGLEDETHPRAAVAPVERFPVGEEEPGFPVEPPAESRPFVEPLELVPPAGEVPNGYGPAAEEPASQGAEYFAASDEALFIAPEPLPTLAEARAMQEPLAMPPPATVAAPEMPFEAPLEDLTPEVMHAAEAPVTPAPVDAPAPAPAAPTAALGEDVVERIVRQVLERIPAPAPAAASPAAPAADLVDDQLERVARRAVELAAPQIERIAWEIIPDMAEMLVRKRIAELEAAAEGEA
ncbi:MAG TPA: response regulator [Thermoanaerobaculaceae bacterium]|nr:response regulator [Thermoanaerobaculaceae bacterium]